MTQARLPMPAEDPATFDDLRRAAERCRACDLWKNATQTVFGEGPVPARLMLMGETPGDHEDQEGRPFVGPAGHLLDRALEDAGIDRTSVYLTNAVKHFKFVSSRGGKVRLHKTPSRAEVAACRQWWEHEVAVVQPRVVGLLGATAAQAVLGSSFRVTKQRGEVFDLDSGRVAIATIHPSAVLRSGDERDAVYAGLVRDLEVIARAEGDAPAAERA